MAKQTSRMYGIKVKEKVNYYEFGANDGFITLFYLSDVGSGAWQIKAGKHDGTNPKSDVEWWYNGSKYDPGDIIETFNDGDILTLHILESHTDVTPYTNYMYDIFGNASENIQYGNKDVVYKVMPGSSTYSCKVTKMENGITVSSKEFTSEDILQYKNSFSMLYPVYNMKFDWHGMDPSSGYPQMSFQAISDSNYIKYNGNTKTKGETINTWQAIGFTGFEVTDDTNKNTAQSSTADAVPSIHLCKRIGGAQICVANKDKKTIFSDVFYDHKDAYYNGHYHKAMFLVYDNPGVADCWKKKLDGLALTYARPYWFLMTTRAGIEYNNRTYEARKLIRSWSPSDSVNMTLKETISRTKEKVEVDIYDKFVYFISEQNGTDQIVIDYKQIVPTDDGEGGYYNDYRDVEVKTISSVDEQPVNYKKLKFELKNGTWTIYSKSTHIVFNGITYKSGKQLIAFPLQGAVDITVYDESDKYQTQYEHIVYDVEQLENVDSVTVKKQIVTQVQDEQGHSHKEYVDLDSTTFDSSSSTVRFQNIEFRRNGTTWTIYSKCGYIKYNGRTYYNNRSILSFAVSEAIHIEIADESDKYIIKEVITYVVKTPDSDITVGYSLHTSETALTMKIVKTSGDKEEPWVTVNFYEAIYQPFMHDDISLMFDTTEMKWELYSNNDNLYYNGTNYKKGDKLGEWPYRQIVKIGNIIVTHENHDAIQISKTSLANGKLIKNEDVDEDIAWHDSESVDFHISYSYAKGIWVIKAVHDCWCDGIKYTEGQIIKQFKTKVYIEPFSILCQYQDDPESPIYTNIVYGLSINITPDGITSITIDSAGHNSVTYSDKDISHGQGVDLIVTKQDARSMYGYIWQKEETPPPPVWVYFILAIIQVSESWSRRDYGSLWYINNINVLDLKVKKDLSYYSWQWYRYELFDYKESFLNRIFIQDIYFTDVTQILICDNITDNDPNFIEYTLGSNLKIVGILNKSTIICISKYYYTEETFVYHQYTLFEDGTSRSTYDVENDNEEFIYDIHRTYYNGNILFNIFGQSGNLLVQTRWREGQDWKWWLFYPYQNIVETIDNNLTNWNQFIQSISWSNIPVNPQPSDIGSKRSRYEIFSVSDNDNNGGRTEECRQFFYNNKIYMYRKVISVQYELYGYEYYGRWYYSERYVENSETIYYKLIVYDVITGNDYLYDIDPTSLYLDYPAVGDNGYIGYHNYSYHPNEYYRFFGGGYYKWRNLGIYFVARLYGNYNPQSYFTDKYSELNKYGIFKLNEETYDVELVKEMASDSYIMINKWNPSTEEFDGQLKFYYFNGILDEETGWIVPIDPDAYSIFRESPNYAEPAIEQVTHIDVNNIPSSMNNGILIRYSTTVSGVSGYYMYIYFDNPYFNASPGNFCMLIHSGNVN